MLTPILVTGHGRGGTTAMMSLLGTDSRVAFERVYAFEHRQLTYLAKLAMTAGRRAISPLFTDATLRDFDNSLVGPAPWSPAGTMDLFPALWGMASRNLATSGDTIYYAEKSPPWLAAFLAQFLPVYSVCLFRDPRDIYLSAMAFMRKRGTFEFGREPGDSDADYARTLCFRWLNFYEPWNMTQGDRSTLSVRYEDFIDSPDRVARTLQQRVGVAVDPAEVPIFHDHHTSASIAGSAGRHRSEALPVAVSRIIGELLPAEMELLGYELSNLSPTPRLLFQELPCEAPHGRIVPAGDSATVDIEGPDFYLALPIEGFEAATVQEFWLCARAPVGDHCSVYWRGPGEAFSEERAIHCHYAPGNHWRVFRFQMRSHSLWSGTVAQMRLDLFNTAGTPDPGTCEVTWLRIVRSSSEG